MKRLQRELGGHREREGEREWEEGRGRVDESTGGSM